MSAHPYIFGAVSGATASDEEIRWAYTTNLFYIGYGVPPKTDQQDIDIKRVTVDPLDGSVVEAFAFGPWDDYLTLPYS